jgi:hypothetical protein
MATQARVLEAIRAGVPRETAARAAGLGPATLYRYIAQVTLTSSTSYGDGLDAERSGVGGSVSFSK